MQIFEPKNVSEYLWYPVEVLDLEKGTISKMVHLDHECMHQKQRISYRHQRRDDTQRDGVYSIVRAT